MSIIIVLLQCDRMWTWENQPEACEPIAHCSVRNERTPASSRQKARTDSQKSPSAYKLHMAHLLILTYLCVHVCSGDNSEIVPGQELSAYSPSSGEM